ncbi:DNA internalization-related competence protein ComEC/Rec2 [Desulfonatronovibrio hydrogenovorans]|uniref:DNA internalization-related competence protein ComEC/Rec2 n=1 Tax=Desulfonatronovibrio hydrogenovorans TaxID=53245 RepID=UPI0004907C6B|nr:DNA internalization-related competence protein ComEC/Rec2 [Desulfonatronovibrio hydrogenovorans]
MRHFSDPSLPQGLLPWQKLVGAYVLGIWSLKYPWVGLSALVLLLAFVPFKKQVRLNFLIVLAFMVGLALVWIRLPAVPDFVPEQIKSSERVVVQGQVENVAFLPGQRQRIILGDLALGRGDRTEALAGKLVWTWQDAPVSLFPGQLVQAHLNVRPIQGLANFGVWNSEFFWRIQDVHWRSYTRGGHFWRELDGDPGRSSRSRQILKEQVSSGYDLSGLSDQRREQVQGLALALFFGDRSLVDPGLMDTIRLASLGHSLALSGLHLGIMAGMGFVLAWLAGLIHPRIYLFFPYTKLGVLLAAPFCLTYIWMGQAPPTLIRSGIMFACWGVLLFMNKRRVLLDGLFMAAGIILVLDPWSIFDLRLQLSLAAVAGIALFLPILENCLQRVRVLWECRTSRYFLGLAGVTLAANLALLPIQAWTFNYLSPHLYLNLAWLPVLGLVILPAGFAGLFISFIPGLGWLGDILFFISGHSLNMFISILEFMVHKDFLHPIVTHRPAWQHTLVYWTLLTMMIYARQISLKNRAHLLGMVFLAGLMAFPMVKAIQDPGLRLRILDVGQGQGVILETPDRKRIIIDGGGSWNPEYDLGRQVVVPSLTWRRWPQGVDLMILSHAHVDHYGGLVYPLKYLGADQYLHNGIWPGQVDTARIRTALDRQDVARDILARGDVLQLTPDLALEVLHPEDQPDYPRLNDTSLVLRLIWDGHGLALIPGDLEVQGITDLLATDQDLSSKVLIVPHHGSRTSADQKLYERVDPDLAVVSRGFMNRFNLPHQEVMDIITSRNIQFFDTAVHGEVVITWKRPDTEPEISWARSRTGPQGIPYWF